jgi:putative PIN family toxin of toxin-antitoxin system
MRIVLDTNVLVSGLLSPHGPPGRIVDGVLDGALTVLWDDRIRDEYEDVLQRPALSISTTLAQSVLLSIESQAEHVASTPWPLALPDPKDAAFLEVAFAGSADALITGNRKHFPAAVCRGVHITSPAEFLLRW